MGAHGAFAVLIFTVLPFGPGAALESPDVAPAEDCSRALAMLAAGSVAEEEEELDSPVPPACGTKGGSLLPVPLSTSVLERRGGGGGAGGEPTGPAVAAL